MRRRWLLASAVAVLALACLSLWLARPKAPFAFLQGHIHVDITPGEEVSRVFGMRPAPGQQRWDYYHYTFRADGKPFVDEATKELRALGYEIMFDDSPGNTHYRASGDSESEVDYVLIYPNTRYRGWLATEGNQDPGWIYVGHAFKESSFWQRLTSSLGL